MLVQKEEKREVIEVPLPKPGKEEVQAAPQFTKGDVGYVLECWRCRGEGKKVQYIGETSRSP